MSTREPVYDTTTKPETREIGLRYNLDVPQIGAIHMLVQNVNTSTGNDWYTLEESTCKEVDECYENHSVQTQGKWRVLSVTPTKGDKWFPRRVRLERVEA